MTLRYLAFALCLVLAAPGCGTPVHTDSKLDPTADFSRYATWAWIPAVSAEASAEVPHGGYVSAIDRERIVRVTEKALAAKGYTQVAEIPQADLAVAYAVGKQQKRSVHSAAGRNDTYYAGFGRGDVYGGHTETVQVYEEGTLVIEVYDREARQLVWSGQGQKRLMQTEDPEPVLRAAIDAILAPLPSRP